MSFAIEFVRILAIALNIVIIARVILSWVKLSPTNPITIIVYGVSEPMLKPVRRLLPNTGGLDFSPIVVIILIMVVQRLLNWILAALSTSGTA
ncbi:MAG: YggT family protein [Dehalococcoidia bacterium]|nr:YggT family protein [Dehalococcoidia bacterium]MQG16295.1 YggT family protein [SAR202 cluster bacterium]